MKTNIFLIFLVLLTTTGCSNKQKKKDKETDSYRVEMKLTGGTNKTNNMAVSLRTSKGCYITDDLKKTSTKELDEPEKMVVDIEGDTACFSVNGKYVIISASCGSSTFSGAMMIMTIYKNDELVEVLTTYRIKPFNIINYNSMEDRL